MKHQPARCAASRIVPPTGSGDGYVVACCLDRGHQKAGHPHRWIYRGPVQAAAELTAAPLTAWHRAIQAIQESA